MSVATFAAAKVLRWLPRVGISRMVGRLCEQPLPAPVSTAVTRAYVKAYSVDMADVAPAAAAYRTFDAFFTRPLREGARPLAPAPLVSPADGRLVDCGPVQNGGAITVKGKPYSVGDLAGEALEGERYVGGTYAVIYLSPRDYHRVHAPVSGTVSVVRGVPGDLYPVNSIGERYVPGLFARNQRVAVAIDTLEHGRVTVVLVGAMIVGRVSVSMLPDSGTTPLGVSHLDPPRRVERGDELGIFHLGSTVVLFTEATLRLSASPGPVRLGEPLVRPA